MGAPALLWPPLLLLLFLMLFGQLPVTLAQAQVCSVNQTLFQVEENKNMTGPLTDIYVPQDQHVVLGPLSTPLAFRIQGNQLFLNVTPDYEETPLLEAQVECRKGNTVVTQLRVFVAVLDVNDNAPEFPFKTKEQDVAEDTKVNTVVIPEADLQATDRDKDDILYYTLQEVTPGASSFFSLMGANRPALKLDRSLDFLKMQNMTFQLLVRDTWEDAAEPSHTATATLVLKVVPADLRAPWFLPCSFSDGYICIQAQYHGVVPTGQRLPFPLILQPGPIYAVDGDQGINQDIIYSIIGGNTNDTFTINADSGNLTMAKIVSSPMTFTLLVKAEQADRARYSVTQVTVEARVDNGNPPQFTQRQYRGIVALGSGAYTAVKDAASPSQLLKIQAVDPDFPELNSAITYRITNCSEFEMDGETVLTTVALQHARVFYAEVEANNTVTAYTATTVAEIRVSELEPPSTGIPGEDGIGEDSNGQHFSTVDMAVLGGVLGALLLITLICLFVLIHKHYSHRFHCCSGRASEDKNSSFDNQAFLPDQKASWDTTPDPESQSDLEPAEPPPAPPSPVSPIPAPPSPETLSRSHIPDSPTAVGAGDSPSAVRSILTKERRPESGYKAVWFGEDIGAEADVVVLNAPTADADDAGDDEESDDEDAESNVGPQHDTTYI